MIKKIVSVFLATVILMAAVAGCSNTEGSRESSGKADVGKTAEGKNADAQLSTDEKNDADTNNDDEDMAEVVLTMTMIGNAPKTVEKAEAAFNAITEPELNVHVTLDILEVGSYEQQLSLRLAGNEKMDLLLTDPFGATSFNYMYSQNQLTPLSDLLDQYGANIVNALGVYLNATKINGEVYGLARAASMASSDYICMRTDILEALGLLEKAKNMKSFTEYEEILQAVKDNYDNVTPIVASSQGVILTLACAVMKENFADCYSVDVLNDSLEVLYVEPGTTKIKNFYEFDEFREMINRVRSWYEKGYVYKDAATTTDTAEMLVKNGVAFSWITSGEIGLEASKASATDYDITAVKIEDHIVGTNNATKFAWVVPVTATEPAAAVKVLNHMYGDARLNKILAWGVEGEDFVVNKDGLADYPEGVDADSVTWHNVDFIVPNQFLTPAWVGSDPELRQKARAEMDNSPVSEFMGFLFDTSTVSKEVAALSNCLKEYNPTIESGMADDGTMDEFLDKLNSCGVDDYIAEAQRQLDEWLAANNK